LPVKRLARWKPQQQHMPELHLCLRESGDERATLHQELNTKLGETRQRP
jgi:hypothetical protein